MGWELTGFFVSGPMKNLDSQDIPTSHYFFASRYKRFLPFAGRKLHCMLLHLPKSQPIYLLYLSNQTPHLLTICYLTFEKCMGAGESKETEKKSSEEESTAMKCCDTELKTTALAVGTVAVVGLAEWGLGSVLLSPDKNKKKMKAPGRDYFI